MTEIFDDAKFNVSYSTCGTSQPSQIFLDEEDEPEEEDVPSETGSHSSYHPGDLNSIYTLY